jgi:hypothetical protein
MPLAFLVPVFLAGLAAIVVPVLVHLRHRERKQPILFPSLMFLRRIPFREVRRQHIHHWPLLLLRLAALALLAFAFARPFLREGGATVAGAGTRRREVVILLDRSASMAYGTRWERARDSVRAVLVGLREGDRATLLLFDLSPGIVTRPTSDRGLLTATLDAAAPGTGGTRYAPALRAARDLLAGSELPRRELVLVSDFQRTGWQGEVLEPLPTGTVFRAVSVAVGTALNAGLSGVELTPASQQGRTTVLVTARITADSGIVRAEASLDLDGRRAGRTSLAIQDGAATTTLGPALIGDGITRGVVRLASGDSLPSDDLWRFVATRDRPVRVLLVDGGDGGSAFVERALAISRSPRVEVTRRTGPLRAADLAAADVIFLHDAPVPAGSAGEQLGRFVAEGGGLIIALGAATVRLPGWVPATVGGVVEPASATIGTFRREHPIFEPFATPRSGDFASTRVFRYRALAEDSLEILARFDAGAPALAERSVGRGRVLLVALSLDNTWSDLPLQPVFLPLVHQLTLYAARHVERMPSYLVGRVASISAEDLARQDAIVVVSPSGIRTRRELTGQPLALPLDEAGFYEVREAKPGGRVLSLVAANIDPEETRLGGFDPADLGVAAGAVDSVAAPLVNPLDVAAADRERRQGLWWFALVAVALLLAAETMVGNRIRGYVRVAPAAMGES